MKTLKALYTVGLFMMANLVMAQSFEGVITMNTTNEAIKEQATLTWYLKNGNSRMDIQSSADGHSSNYSIIVDGKGMDMVSQGHVTSIPQTAMKVENAGQTLLSEKTGVQMNGYNCTQAVYFDGQNQTTYWFTNDLALEFNDLPSVIKRNMPSVEASGFPVKMEKRNPQGKVILSQEVISVSASTVDNGKFERR